MTPEEEKAYLRAFTRSAQGFGEGAVTADHSMSQDILDRQRQYEQDRQREQELEYQRRQAEALERISPRY